MTKVSVIIPVYNTIEFVEECVNSVLQQTYKNIEVILINDNSNTGCTDILENFAEKERRIKLFHFQEREGAGAARNFGIQKASGEFIYFLDSDDYIPEKTLQILVDNIKDNNMIRGMVKLTYFSSGMAVVLEGLFKSKSYSDKKFQLLENYSAVNYLFRKDFVLSEQLSFSENVEVYADLAFMVPALIPTEQVPYIKEAVYFKRKRNDPILNPSLSQYGASQKIRDFLFLYNELKDKYNNKLASNFLDKQLLNFYRKDIVTYFNSEKGIETFYEPLSDTLKKVDDRLINQHGLFLKKEVTALRSGISKYKRTNKRHQLFRDMKNVLKSIKNRSNTRRKIYTLLYKRLFSKWGMKEDLIFFESFFGKSYSDSPKYIYEYMLNHNMDYKCVWSLNEKTNIPGNPIQVKRFSLRYFYYLARAKYWVSNSRLPRFLDKRKGNVYLQTWHGTPLKKLVFDMDDVHSADPNYKEHFFEQSRRWDYLSSPNQYSTDIFRRAFKYNKQMLEFGYPRNDILYKKNNNADIINLKRELNIPTDKKVILYAPTWRDDEFISRGKYKFNLQLDLQKMKNELGDEYIVLLRMHYFIASHMDISDFKGFAYDFSSYDDIAELYLVSDLLITDYSSVFFDFANLKRPILFYTYDLEKYRDTLRGFYIDIEKDLPGPLIRTTDDIINRIQNIDEMMNEYRQNYNTFYEAFCKWDDGNAAEKTVKAVFGDKI